MSVNAADGKQNVRSWGHSRRVEWAALTVSYSQKEKFSCRELSKTTSSCRDPSIEANASAGGSRSRRLSVSKFRVEGSGFLLSVRSGTDGQHPRRRGAGMAVHERDV